MRRTSLRRSRFRRAAAIITGQALAFRAERARTVSGDDDHPMASQQLSVHSRLQPYIPRLTLEWLATEPDRIHRSVEGTLAFSDRSGYPALSQKIAYLPLSAP